MMRATSFIVMVGILGSFTMCIADEPAEMPEDRFLWLEDVEGEQALDWVRSQNSVTLEKLEADPGYAKLRQDLLAILDSNERIPFVTQRGEFLYNFWKDQKNPRGLWRRTTLDEFRKAEPQWDVLIDLDELAKAESENWVWSGVKLLKPDYTRALVALSRGGADATTTREFDLNQRTWVADGFIRPEAKGSLDWIDRDHVFVQTDFGPGSLTDSGYPRIAKRWTRGTPLSAAETIFEGQAGDVSISATHDDSPGFERNFVHRSLAFYSDELFLLEGSGKLVKLDVPNSAEKDVFQRYLALELRDPWTLGEQTFPAGALVIAPFDDVLAGHPKFEMVFEPSPTSALASFSFTKDHLLINVLEDVKNRIYVLSPSSKGWSKKPLVGVPELGRVEISAVDPDDSNDYFLTTTDYLTPTTLSRGEVGQLPEALKSLPRFFSSDGLAIRQEFATSADGTRVPYFLVSAQDLPLNGDHPTLLYGYGGFEISLLPQYLPHVGRAWLSQGGVYVVANIRGGGEYGPRWHQAALKKNRPKAYADFAAVAQDLIARKITSPRRLGIQGGSNGGLLVGNMVTKYPDLFRAAVCQVPLLDMRRYHKLLAGASWMAEYGNPDLPEEWEFIQHYSPYQNVQSDGKYPAVLYMTSTRDDRVHPGHARKMMALMKEQGHPVWYYENIEGGHGGAANNDQAATMQALAFTFLKLQLFDEPKSSAP